jgi:hypothetical protein
MEEAQNASTMVHGTSLVNSILSLPFLVIYSFSAPKNLGARFILMGVVFSQPKISNFGM